MRVKKSNIEIIKDYLAGERPFVTVGYKPPPAPRKEGERWKDVSGVTWEQRDGYKVRVNEQATLIKEIARQKCACGQDIQYGNRYDEKVFGKTGKCYECFLKEQQELRILGVFPQFEQYKLISNYLGFLEDLRQKIEESINYFKTEGDRITILCNSEGYLEHFRGINTQELLENAIKDLAEIKKTIKAVTSEKNKAKKLFETDLKEAKKRIAAIPRS